MLDVHVSVEFPASVSIESLLTVSRAMKLGPKEAFQHDKQLLSLWVSFYQNRHPFQEYCLTAGDLVV